MIARALTALKRLLSNAASGRMFTNNKLGLSDLLLYAKIVAQGIILQSDGSFLSAFFFRGSDLETSSDAQLSLLSEQLNIAFSLFGNGWMFHVDTVRFSATKYIDKNANNFHHKVAALIDHERRLRYEQQGVYYENYYVFSITYKPTIDFGSKIGLFFRRKEQSPSITSFSDGYHDNHGDVHAYTAKSKHKQHKDASNLSYHLEYFTNKLREITALLTQQLNLVAMNDQQLLSYLSYCLTGEHITLKIPVRYGVYLKHLLASRDVIGGELPKIGTKYLFAITVMGFPSESYPSILDELNYADFSYRFNTRFIAIDSYSGNKIIEKTANLWYQKRISALDTIKMSLAIDSNIKINQHASEQYQETQKAKALSEGGSASFGFYTATIVLLNEDLVQIKEHANYMQSKLRSLGFASQIERYHALEAWLGSLPGFAYANIRKWLIHTQNMADIIPNTSIWSGLSNNPCSLYKLDSPPLFYAMTNGQTPMRISLHVGDNGHTLIIGPTGSGKSTLLNFIIAQHFRYDNARVFVFDKNKSSLPLCLSLGGDFYDIGDDSNQRNFQPLAHLDTDFDFAFAANWLEELCLLNGLAQGFNDNHRRAIYKALHLMRHEVGSDRRTISYFRYLVQDYDNEIACLLDGFSSEMRTDIEYSQASLSNRIFDDHSDKLALSSSRFSVFEMSKLMQLGDRIIIPAINYLIHVINKQLGSGVPTLIVFDESFIFFKHPLFCDKIIEWIKTVRKFNVAIIFASQELEDMMASANLRSALLNNCATKIFLANKQATSSGIYEHYKAMGLNEKQIQLVAKSFKYEYLYYSELGTRKFQLNLLEDKLTFSLTARTSADDIKEAGKIWQQTKGQAHDFLALWLDYCQVESGYLNNLQTDMNK